MDTLKMPKSAADAMPKKKERNDEEPILVIVSGVKYYLSIKDALALSARIICTIEASLD